ncbi:DUF488 domain-containing protein [Sphingosinicella rhizophila]|uniref:DUF488 domain-containing protein n=1 Tax=Sphingosinicella rhizophila TaxID=3050082 RepID=A0ABU3QBQ6_9SPHN|nr:DUF488 domain-containing protein [Sphingosinicella sp. GR2756]MDT9600836.1 DUF488 domain-containing protein [Sphingosinicella sp. GR2756]
MATDAEAHPIYTVGHSTHSIEAFVELLRHGNVQRLVDVRSIPRSRTNPQYNLDALPEALARWQISHTIIPELGGRRPRQKGVPGDVNDYWRNRSFHNYADYAMSAEFRAGLEHLIRLSLEAPCAIMCSEAVWWRCHRRIIADYLLLQGRVVFHLMAGGRVESATITPAAMAEGEVLIYPSQATERGRPGESRNDPNHSGKAADDTPEKSGV